MATEMRYLAEMIVTWLIFNEAVATVARTIGG